ncbi:MAG: hypothetical protein R3E53_07370 [Myxococcota bacterium]
MRRESRRTRACAMAASRLATLATRLGSMRAMLDRELAVYEARAQRTRKAGRPAADVTEQAI